jgi:hypothetical protein
LHSTQVRLDVSHTPRLPEQSLSLTHPTHECEPTSQAGVLPPQFLSDVHATHVLFDVLHAGRLPLQSLSVQHCPDARQRPPHSMPPLHWHTCEDEQTFPPLHSELPQHPELAMHSPLHTSWPPGHWH